MPCNQEVYRELTRLIAERKIESHQPIFTGEADQPIDHDNFSKRVFKKDLSEWGGRKITFHQMRHSSITHMVGSGIDLRTVQEIAGHEHITTTMGYTHRVAENIKEVGRTFAIKPTTEKPQLRLVASAESA